MRRRMTKKTSAKGAKGAKGGVVASRANEGEKPPTLSSILPGL